MIKNLAKGIVFGSIVGGTLGILFAPRSGKETQEKISTSLSEGIEATNQVNRDLQKFEQSLQNLKETAAELLPSFVDGVNQAVIDYEFQSEPRIKQIQKQSEKIQRNLNV